MKIRVAASSATLALALAGFLLAQGNPSQLTAVGTVVSTSRDSMVVRIDTHGHPIPFVIGTATEMPPGLAVGSRVSVLYHPIGTSGQMADTVTLLEGPALSSRPLPEPTNGVPGPMTAQASPEKPSAGPESQPTAQPTDQPATPAAQLPGTASPLPFIGLAGLLALLGSVSLRALERRRS